MIILMEWGVCVLMRDVADVMYYRCHSFRHRLAGCGQACTGEKDAKVSVWFTVHSHLLVMKTWVNWCTQEELAAIN